jgi:hypothetical protein
MNEQPRNLTDGDVEAIVVELKQQLVSDFYGEVGRGIWGWVKKALWVLLFILALQGIAGDRSALDTFARALGSK